MRSGLVTSLNSALASVCWCTLKNSYIYVYEIYFILFVPLEILCQEGSEVT